MKVWCVFKYEESNPYMVSKELVRIYEDYPGEIPDDKYFSYKVEEWDVEGPDEDKERS